MACPTLLHHRSELNKSVNRRGLSSQCPPLTIWGQVCYQDEIKRFQSQNDIQYTISSLGAKGYVFNWTETVGQGEVRKRIEKFVHYLRTIIRLFSYFGKTKQEKYNWNQEVTSALGCVSICRSVSCLACRWEGEIKELII